MIEGMIHTPSPREVEIFFTDTPEAAEAEAASRAAMTEGNSRLQERLCAHIGEIKARRGPEPDAFDIQFEGVSNA